MDSSKLLEELHFMQQAYATLFSVVNKVQVRGDDYMEEITSRQHMALVAIVHLPTEKTTLINIAKMLGTTKQTANKLITSLEKKGFVKTIPSKIDKRAINVEITQDGTRVMVTSSEKSVYFLADMFHEFSTDEIETFWKLLQKLYRFDGEEQNGFEENANFDNGENSLASDPDYQQKVMAEFIRRRYNDENKGGIK